MSSARNPPQYKVLLGRAIKAVGLTEAATALERYKKQDEIREYLGRAHKRRKIADATTGWITESVCSWALEDVIPSGYARLGKNEKWIGDFSLLGYPFNAILSVKSFTAKERLLVSGLGVTLAPTIGFGWFKNSKEFSAERCQSFRDKAFIAIYMPGETLDGIEPRARKFSNSNGRPLLRDVMDLPNDLRAALTEIQYGKQRLTAISTRLI